MWNSCPARASCTEHNLSGWGWVGAPQKCWYIAQINSSQLRSDCASSFHNYGKFKFFKAFVLGLCISDLTTTIICSISIDLRGIAAIIVILVWRVTVLAEIFCLTSISFMELIFKLSASDFDFFVLPKLLNSFYNAMLVSDQNKDFDLIWYSIAQIIKTVFKQQMFHLLSLYKICWLTQTTNSFFLIKPRQVESKQTQLPWKTLNSLKKNHYSGFKSSF